MERFDLTSPSKPYNGVGLAEEVVDVTGRARVIGIAAVLGLVATFGAACGGGDSQIAGVPAGTTSAPDGASSATQPPAGTAGGTSALEGLDLQIPALSAKIVKNATLTLEVDEGSFDQRFQQAILIAGTHGGFVSSSRASGQDSLSGTVVIRVPSSEFEVALGELKALGTVEGEEVSGEDVTAEFVDLDARLRNWEAQETVLLGLMAETNTIDESLKVQRALQDVQLAIEEIRGQLRVIDDQTSLSTISVSMSEPGVPVAADPDPDGVPSVSEAWDLALKGFLAVIATVVIGIGYALPFVIVGLIAWAIIRRVRRPKVVPTA